MQPLVNPRRACARVTVVVLSVCLSVYPSVPALGPLKPANNGTHGVLLGFSWINMCGVSKKPSVQKLWREKANMQMS